MTNRKIAYLTIAGRPLCECGTFVTHDYNLTCGYRSLADAKRAKAMLQAHFQCVRVVAGPCPSYAAQEA